MSVKDIHRRQWACDWKCGSPRAVTYTDGKDHRIITPPGWSRIWGGGDPGAGDPYPIHLCPDCTALYNDCHDGKSERGKRFRAAYKLFCDAEKAFIDPTQETVDEPGELRVVVPA